MIFNEGYGNNVISSTQTTPVAAIWDDGGTEGESVIAVELRLNGQEYSKGLVLLERIFEIVRQVFPVLKGIRRDAPKTYGHQIVLRCTAETIIGTDSGFVEASVSEKVKTESYTEIFQSEPRVLCKKSEEYEILIKGIFMTEDELREMKDIRIGSYIYRKLSIREIKKRGGIIESALMISLWRDKI